MRQADIEGEEEHMELSPLQTEEILNHFNDIQDGEFAEIAHALRDLATLPEILAAENPPLLPSDIVGVVRTLGKGAKRTALVISSASAALIASALAAAALTGVGPKPIVKFAQSTLRTIENSGKQIFGLSITPATSDPVQSTSETINGEVVPPHDAGSVQPTTAPEQVTNQEPSPATTQIQTPMEKQVAPILPPSPKSPTHETPKPQEVETNQNHSQTHTGSTPEPVESHSTSSASNQGEGEEKTSPENHLPAAGSPLPTATPTTSSTHEADDSMASSPTPNVSIFPLPDKSESSSNEGQAGSKKP